MFSSDSGSDTKYGMLFIVLLLFFGIFNRNGGFFGGGNTNGNGLGDLVALKALQTGGAESCCSPCQTDRDVLELKCNVISQNALLNQNLDTAFRTIISNQDAGFAGLRTAELEDQIRARDMTLMAQNSEIQALKTNANIDRRMDNLEHAIGAVQCQMVKEPPFRPQGCFDSCTPPWWFFIQPPTTGGSASASKA